MKKYISVLLMTLIPAILIHAENNDYGYGNESCGFNYFCEGTVWESGTVAVEENEDAESILDLFVINHIRTWIEGSESINGTEYLNIFTATEKNEYQNPTKRHIRTEGNKVFFLNEENPEDIKEVLMFDFDIEIGTEPQTSAVFCGNMMTEMSSSLKCLEINQESSEGNTLETFLMELSLDGHSEGPWVQPIRWIKGIGSEAGPLDNVIGPDMGGSRLITVSHNGNLVYKYTGSSEVNQILDSQETIRNGTKYHLDGSIFREGDTGVYIQNGHKFYKAN